MNKEFQFDRERLQRQIDLIFHEAEAHIAFQIEWRFSQPPGCQAGRCNPADTSESRCCGWQEGAPPPPAPLEILEREQQEEETDFTNAWIEAQWFFAQGMYAEAAEELQNVQRMIKARQAPRPLDALAERWAKLKQQEQDQAWLAKIRQANVSPLTLLRMEALLASKTGDSLLEVTKRALERLDVPA